MKINLKLALISLFIIFVLTGISGFIVYSVIYPSFSEVQSQQNQRDAQRLKSLFLSEMDTLDGSADNWAKSDTMVRLADNYRLSGSLEITPSMLRDVGADIVLILNADGHIVRSIYYLQSGQKLIVAIPKPLQDLLLPIARRTLEGEEHSGFLPCTNDFCVTRPAAAGGESREEFHIPIMLSVRKILPSDRTGDVHGVLLMGRGITRAVLGAVSERIGLEILAPVGVAGVLRKHGGRSPAHGAAQ